MLQGDLFYHKFKFRLEDNENISLPQKRPIPKLHTEFFKNSPIILRKLTNVKVMGDGVESSPTRSKIAL